MYIFAIRGQILSVAGALEPEGWNSSLYYTLIYALKWDKYSKIPDCHHFSVLDALLINRVPLQVFFNHFWLTKLYYF